MEHPTLMQLSRDKAVPIYGVDWKDAKLQQQFLDMAIARIG